jgi:PAS domain S-box-containing protein
METSKELERTMLLSHFTIEKDPDAILWIDSEDRIHRVNDATCRMLGYAPEEMVGKKPPELGFGLDPAYVEKLRENMRQHGIVRFERTIETRDGRTLPVEVTGCLVNFENQEYVCWFARDITERRKADAALKQAFHEIEQLKNRLQEENVYLQQEIKLTHNFEAIIGKSHQIQEVLHAVEHVAETDATVLILGETGTGKELIARAIHNISLRHDRPLVKVNCAALPATLIESELFGHEKGAFTGALKAKVGRFELANGGTIFLDEIGELPIEMQVKLLRVIQSGEFERLGGPQTLHTDVRIIAATNRDLEKAVAAKTFREDLFYRLNVFPIRVPPLRERREDLPLLVDYFVREYAKKIGREINVIPRSVLSTLENYNWPGNIRELENIIERSVILCLGPQFEIGNWFHGESQTEEEKQHRTLTEVERAHILKVLDSTHWRVSGPSGAAQILGINPQTLVSRMKKLGIQRGSSSEF